MNITDEMLMAYADGELDADMRAKIEAEIAIDVSLAKKVEQYRALRAQLNAAFDPVLNEPMPDRLQAVIQSPATRVVDLAQVRDAKAAAHGVRTRLFSAPHWMAIAASAIFGILIGVIAFRSDRATIVAQENGLIAKGALARTLTEELASTPKGNSFAHIGLSYAAKSGDFCRSFVITDAQHLAGIACHARNAPRDDWRIRALLPTESTANGNYRTAASSLPPALIEQINREIDGEPFDAAMEAQHAAQGWSR